MGAVPLGAGPDMVLSPDGHRLYVASGTQGHTDVVNTQTGKIESTFVTNRLAQLGGGAFSSMIVSPNNRWLLVVEVTGAPPDPVTYALAAYDTYQDNKFVGETMVPGCGVGRLAWVGEKLGLHCYGSNTATIFNVDETGKITRAKPWLTLKRQKEKIANVLFLEDAGRAVVFAESGAVTDVGFSGQENKPKTTQSPVERRINFGSSAESDDGRTIYIATGPKEALHSQLSDEILIFDATVWGYTGAIKTSVPFFSLAFNHAAGILYAISPSERKILTIDVAQRTETNAISLPAARPKIAIVAP
jgi:hypothetical protein